MSYSKILLTDNICGNKTVFLNIFSKKQIGLDWMELTNLVNTTNMRLDNIIVTITSVLLCFYFDHIQLLCGHINSDKQNLLDIYIMFQEKYIVGYHIFPPPFPAQNT